MGKICPICNEISMITFKCEKCQGIMVDKGRMQEYLDDYSADMPIEDSLDYCIHIFKCTNCNDIQRKKVAKVNI